MGLPLSFGGTECGDLILQAMVKIEDMAVSLILEEWGCQNLARRNLSRDHRQEHYGNVFSQGKNDQDYCLIRLFCLSLLVVGSLTRSVEC